MNEHLELSHVLFLDLVGYSIMDMEAQRKSLEDLQGLIGQTPHFVEAERTGNLIALPTGDGMALLFFGDPTCAAECALEISRATRQNPVLRMRMGLHSGPVYRVADINQRLNAAGGGINTAQRVMDAGDAGHILVSSAMADVLRQLGTWKNRLTDLGEHPAKHGAIIHFYNLFTESAGNAAWPGKLVRPRQSSARLKWQTVVVSVVAFVALAASSIVFQKQKLSGINAETESTSPALQLEYSVTVQRYKNGRPFREPFRLAGEILFQEDYRIAINIHSPQPGFLYVLNEGPLPDGSISLNVLYPSPGATAQLATNQPVRIPQREWFVFDQGSGIEKLYLAWSARSVAEFDSVKDLTTSLMNGLVVIRDPARLSELRQKLSSHLIPTEIHKEEEAKRTLLFSSQEVLVHLIRLEHH